MNEQAKSYLNLEDAARRLGASQRQVLRYIGAGLLPATKISRDWILLIEDINTFKRPKRGRPPKNTMP